MEFQLLFPLICSFLALGFVVILSVMVLKKEEGTQRMKDISRLIQEGARAFLKREYRYITIFVVLIAGLISITPFISKGINLGWKTSIAFIIGSFMSAFAGYIGMSIATKANSRTANAASKGGVKAALNVAISGGSVMGMSVVGLALLGLIVVYFVFKGDPVIINGYAMGASLVALFARSGGGIFTKGADMGADLVGKVEAGIPEDDPRNPAVIADNVGDNVGDCAG
ncbi:sodium/proton-translocating pyrophosphatase, partial [bacterium]|nr:sodium/proton-translocating pyrophosphatase [bacterium]